MADLNIKRGSLKLKNAEEVEDPLSVVYSIETETPDKNRGNQLLTRLGENIFENNFKKVIIFLIQLRDFVTLNYITDNASINSSKSKNIFKRVVKSVAIVALCKSIFSLAVYGWDIVSKLN